MFIRDQTINGKQNKIIDVCRATSENVLPSKETIIFPTISLEKLKNTLRLKRWKKLIQGKVSSGEGTDIIEN